MPFHPYLFFGGNCREAFTRYQEIFGGELVLLTPADTPDPGDFPDDQAEMVIHAALTRGDELLMGSDHLGAAAGPAEGMMVTYGASDADDARARFEALADGGEVTQDLIETFFSPAFGLCVDRFGTPWMVVADAVEEAG